MREFLFTYHFGGKSWGTSVFATTPSEAREKIKTVGMARYDGELVARIPVSGWLARLICWWRTP
jgi:hypothetical protein